MKKALILALALGIAVAAAPVSAAPNDHKKAAHAGGKQAATHVKARKHPPAKAHRAATRTVKKSAAQPAHRAVTTKKRTTHTKKPKTTKVRRKVTTHAKRSVNITKYRKVVRAPRRYHAARAWVAPRGFSYRRFSLGERIPSVLLAATYFLTDFSLYGLESPPTGYVWVRDGTDAVLVDRYTGEVIQVEYDVFY